MYFLTSPVCVTLHAAVCTENGINTYKKRVSTTLKDVKSDVYREIFYKLSSVLLFSYIQIRTLFQLASTPNVHFSLQHDQALEMGSEKQVSMLYPTQLEQEAVVSWFPIVLDPGR